LTTEGQEQPPFVYEEWPRRVAAADLEGVLDLYDHEAVFESPLVARLFRRDSGYVQGREDLRAFFLRAAQGPPPELPRGHRSGRYFFDGRTLAWEYPRATPDGDQFDLAEFMDLEDGRIVHHRVYWGWKGLPILRS
jgi:steroid Delta-isomerase